MSLQNVVDFLNTHELSKEQLLILAGLSNVTWEELKDTEIDDTVRMFWLTKIDKAMECFAKEQSKNSAEVLGLTEMEIKMLQSYRRLNEQSKSKVRRILSAERAKQIWVEA